MSQPNVGPTRRSTSGTPRWVKVLGIILIVLVLLFVTLHLTGTLHHTETNPMGDMPTTQQGMQQP